MNDIINKNYKKLALQVAVNALSFCCMDTLNHEIISCKTVVFSKYRPIEQELWRVFIDHTELTRPYDEVTVLHDNSYNTFIPSALFDENYMGSYLQYNTKVFETDFFTYDAVGNYDINNVYVPLVNVNNFLIDQFGEFEYRNTNSILAAKLLEATKNNDNTQVFVHIQDSHFEIMAGNNQKLILYNSFEYKTPEDFLYYLLFTMEQLHLNPEVAPVAFLGAVNLEHACYKIAYKYIREISFFDITATAGKWSTTPQLALQYYILLNS